MGRSVAIFLKIFKGFKVEKQGEAITGELHSSTSVNLTCTFVFTIFPLKIFFSEHNFKAMMQFDMKLKI